MKKNIRLTLLLGSALIALAAAQQTRWKPQPKDATAIRVLLVTGGHDHDVEFYSVFDDAGLKTLVDPHPAVFGGDLRRRAAVLVLCLCCLARAGANRTPSEYCAGTMDRQQQRAGTMGGKRNVARIRRGKTNEQNSFAQ